MITKKEILENKNILDWQTHHETTNFYVLPLRKIHESGYRKIKIAFYIDNVLYTKTDYSDVLDFEYNIKRLISDNLFCMDVNANGVMQFFCRSRYKFRFTHCLSTCTIQITE